MIEAFGRSRLNYGRIANYHTINIAGKENTSNNLCVLEFVVGSGSQELAIFRKSRWSRFNCRTL
jgi:hypothetical protein